MTDTGAKKKLSSDATALNLNVEASATIVNGYQPGNLVSLINKFTEAFVGNLSEPVNLNQDAFKLARVAAKNRHY